MEQNEIAKAFRKLELQQREARRKIMLNYAKLEPEVLTPTEQAIHSEVIKELQEASLKFEKEVHPSYWRRLWRALCNR